MNDFNYEVKERIGIISVNDESGWTKELNVVSFNGRPAKFDVREWSPDHKKMSKGMTFTEEEMETIAALVADRYIKAREIDEVEDIEKPKAKVLSFPAPKPKIKPKKTEMKPKKKVVADIELPF